MDINDFNIPRFLAVLPLFSDLSPMELERVAKGCQVRRLARGDNIFRYGEPCEEFHVVVSGQVKLFAISPAGQEKVIELVGPGHSFAEALMFTDKPYILNAQSLANTLLLTVGKLWAAAAALALALAWLSRQALSLHLRAATAAMLIAGLATTLATPWWGEALQGPVRRLAALAQDPALAAPGTTLVQWRLHRPSVAVYRGAPAPRRAPAPGELALVPMDRLTADDHRTLDLLGTDRDLALVRRVAPPSPAVNTTH